MSEIFLDVLNRSIAASWVVLAVILARALMKKAPRAVICYLWWLVGFRLTRFTLPQTSFSLIPSAETITPESLFDREPVITSGVEIIDNVVNPIYTESFRATEVASVNPLQVWIAVAANIWILVQIGILVWSFVSWLRIRRRVAASVCLRDNIYICDAIDTPFILGVWKPKIYLPSTLGEEQMSHVIAHEQAHIRRLDHWYKPLAYLLLTVNWFNPLIWIAYILLCRDIELACDEQVIRTMNTEEKKGYSSALLECSIHRHVIAACPLAFGEVGVKERVKAVLSYKKPGFWIMLAALAVTVALAVCFVTDPIDKVPEIRYDGYLYVQNGDAVDHLPDKLQTIDTLRSTLHDSTPHPTEDGQSVGLSWEYAGQPMYLVGNALYLEEPGGGSWLKFVRQTTDEEQTGNQLGIHLTFENKGYELSICLPDGWEAEKTSKSNFDGIAFRFQPEDAEGFIHVQYENTPFYESDTVYDIVEFSYPNGVTATRYIGARGEWSYIKFNTTQGDLYAFQQSTLSWTEEQLQTAEAVLSTLTACVDGTDILTEPNPLGIHLSVENPSPTGLTLITTQDGTLWDAIYTGSYFTIEKWDGTAWVALATKENTAWTMEAYGVPLNETTRSGIGWEWVYGRLEPGSYRISKSYSGERGFLADREKVDVTYYAEFTIE